MFVCSVPKITQLRIIGQTLENVSRNKLIKCWKNQWRDLSRLLSGTPSWFPFQKLIEVGVNSEMLKLLLLNANRMLFTDGNWHMGNLLEMGKGLSNVGAKLVVL